MANQDFIDRLRIEHKELSLKIDKLEDFIDGDIYPTLKELDRHLLALQLLSMKQYRHILSLRLTGIKG